MKRSLYPDGIIGEFYQIFKEEIITVFHKLTENKRGEEGILLNSFCEVSITL